MYSYYRIKLFLLMMPLLFVYGKAQCNDWCNVEDCNGQETVACDGTRSRLLTSLFPLLQNQDQIFNIFFIRTTDVMLVSYTFYNASLTNLQRISISQVPLRTIADGAFAGLPLQSLTLSFTELETFSVGILEGLDPTVLGAIDLTSNQIHYLSSDLLPFFSNMSAGSIINLEGNPLMCDCHMNWVSQLPSTVIIQNAICMEPASLQGQNLQTVLPRLNQTCPDICSTSLNNCPTGTNCSVGSYPVPLICTCQPAVSDATECVDIDECATSKPCAFTEICINTRESYTCYNCTPTAIVNTLGTPNECELCPQGFIANLTENTCQRCPVGTIVDTPNNTCLECPPGSIANITENYCQQCPPRSTVDHTNNLCQQCPQGHIANVSQNYCQECPLRSIVDVPNNRCQECHPGSIANYTANYCQDCPLGSIVSSNQCQSCPQGFIANITTNTCQMCPLGSIVNISSNQCHRCQLGFVANVSENVCQKCPFGSVVNISINQCQRCPLGLIANTASNSCQGCPLGSVANATENNCQSCPLGSIANVSTNQCQKCPSGFITNITENICQECPLGSIVTISSNQCQRCPLGMIANVTSNSCQWCPQGYVVVVDDNRCQICPQGSIANTTSNYCQMCPNGSIVNATNNLCQSCPPGSIANVTASQCQMCPEGLISDRSTNQCRGCPDGSIVDIINNQCLPCPPGSIVNRTSNMCQSCPIGSIVNIETYQCQACPHRMIANTTSNTCEQCPPHSIANITSNICQRCSNISIVDIINNQCQVCPHGLVVNIEDNQCESCTDGSHYNSATFQCQTCPTNTYFNSTINLCQTCPEGLHYNTTTNQCVRCPVGTEYNDVLMLCVACHTGEVYIAETGSCYACSDSGMIYNDTTLMCQFCPSHTQFEASSRTCQPCERTAAYYEIDHICFDCSPLGMIPNDDRTMCVSCEQGTIFDHATEVCQFCANMTEYNLTTMTCIDCPRNTQYNYTTRSCDACLEAKLYNGICIQCDPNEVVNNLTGQCEQCPGDLVFNPTTAECECLCPNTMICFEQRFCACPPGMIHQVDQCINTTEEVHCNAEVLDDTLWNTVESDTVAIHPCPFTTSRLEMQTRLCQSNGLWSNVDNSACPSQEIVKLWEDSSILNANISETDLTNFASTLTQLLQATPPTSGDLPLIQDLLNRSVLVFDNVQSREVANNISQDIVSSLSILFSHDSLMAWMNATNSSELLTSLTVTLDMLGSELVRFAEDERVLINAPGIVLQVVAISPNSNQSINITLPSLNSTSGLSYIVLPADIINNITVKGNGSSMCQLGVVSTVIEDLGSLLPPQDEYAITPPPPSNPQCGEPYMVATGPPIINSVVLSSFIASPNCEVNTTDLNLPVLITLQHDEIQHGNPQCVFLNTKNAAWSGDGCSVRQRGLNYTVCQCNHLTSFAIVMNPEGAETSTDHHLRIASKVGLALSVIALVASILMLFGLGVKDSTYLYKIHGNLAIALCLAQSVFLIGVDRVAVPSPDGLCIFIAILLHYLLLATWAWMLVEGVHLYMMLVRIFYNRKIFYFYVAAAWGAPIVIVAITLGSRFEDYGTECFCWINANNDNHGTIWSFHGPAIAIICINTFILVLTMVVVIRIQRRVESHIVRSAFRATLVLLPVLGITWALGFLVVTTETETVDTIIEWLFFSFNTLQGVIFFVLFCLANRELRLAFLKKFGCRQVAIDIEREVSWTRRPSMQISSALHWARRASNIDSLMDSSRKLSRRDSNTSNHSDSSNPAFYNYNPRPSLLVSRLQETLAEAEEDSLENFELNQTETQDVTLLDVDPATGEILRNPSPDQSPE